MRHCPACPHFPAFQPLTSWSPCYSHLLWFCGFGSLRLISVLITPLSNTVPFFSLFASLLNRCSLFIQAICLSKTLKFIPLPWHFCSTLPLHFHSLHVLVATYRVLFSSLYLFIITELFCVLSRQFSVSLVLSYL